MAPVGDSQQTCFGCLSIVQTIYKTPTDPKSIPNVCAKPVTSSDNSKGVGILYRSTAGQDPDVGEFAVAQPLLDCVADMQVVLSLDTNGDGTIDSHSQTAPVPLGSATTTNLAQTIRNQVREARVYILAQEGRRSPDFKYPGYPDSRILVGETINGVTYGESLYSKT